MVATLVHPGKSAQHALNYFNSYILNKHTFATVSSLKYIVNLVFTFGLHPVFIYIVFTHNKRRFKVYPSSSSTGAKERMFESGSVRTELHSVQV